MNKYKWVITANKFSYSSPSSTSNSASSISNFASSILSQAIYKPISISSTQIPIPGFDI